MLRHKQLHLMIQDRIETLRDEANMIELLDYLKALKEERSYWKGGIDDDNFNYNDLITKLEVLIKTRRNRKIDQLLQADQIN